MQALNSNVMKVLNLKARSMSVARVTLYNIKYVIMKAIIRYCYFSPKMSFSCRNYPDERRQCLDAIPYTLSQENNFRMQHILSLWNFVIIGYTLLSNQTLFLYIVYVGISYHSFKIMMLILLIILTTIINIFFTQAIRKISKVSMQYVIYIKINTHNGPVIISI